MMALTINKPNAEAKMVKHIFVFMRFAPQLFLDDS
jgi:hypothetical protein